MAVTTCVLINVDPCGPTYLNDKTTKGCHIDSTCTDMDVMIDDLANFAAKRHRPTRYS